MVELYPYPSLASLCGCAYCFAAWTVGGQAGQAAAASVLQQAVGLRGTLHESVPLFKMEREIGNRITNVVPTIGPFLRTGRAEGGGKQRIRRRSGQ